MSKEIIGARQVAEDLSKYFPEVKWDRFVREDKGAEQSIMPYDLPVYTLYGWLDRDDAYKDFVIITFTWNGSFTYYTSSAKYSEIFCERINGSLDTHTDCERVENWFPDIKNVVKLNK